jgi:hypothetical protein
MRKIDLRPYEVQLPQGDGSTRADVYRVRESLVETCFFPTQSPGAHGALRAPTGSELLKRNRLAEKIAAWPDETLLLEEPEWQALVAAIESGEMHLGRFGVEFARRILEAPEVAVREAP